MKRFFYLAVAFASLISFASCKDDDEEKEDGKQDTPVVVPEKVDVPEEVETWQLSALGIDYEAQVPNLVDLGLSVKWATHNIGALRITDCGYYISWGDSDLDEYIDGYECNSYGRTWYSTDCPTEHKSYGQMIDEKIIDKNGNLTSKYDYATIKNGENFRMPTIAEFNELLNKCEVHNLTINFVELQGPGIYVKKKINGIYVRSKINGNAIFLPSAGMYDPFDKSFKDVGEWGNYWSSTALDNKYNIEAKFFTFNKSAFGYEQVRRLGFPIRPVENK